MKIDPYKHKETYEAWKERVGDGIPNLSKYNSDLALQYITDMERGINVASASAKGSRSYIRLNSLREKMVFFCRKFKEIYNLDKVTDIKEDQLLIFFSDIKSGVIKRKDGRNYKSIDTQGKIFKAFWHWWMKINRKKGLEIPDITTDLDTRAEKPDWVYLTDEEVKLLCDNAKPEYRALIMFLLDSGIRPPTELMNVKVSDLYSDCKEVNIRDEISKTFGRRIKLMLCSDILKRYIKNKGLKNEDYLFPIDPSKVNQYLKRLAKRVLGEVITPAGSKTSELTMYDFRHIACCYWLPRYKSESALKYRFGWKKSDKIHYYSELLGMKDTIAEEDLLIDTTKTEIEKQLEKERKEKEIMKERMQTMEFQMAKILELTNRLNLEVAT
jgi:integrase